MNYIEVNFSITVQDSAEINAEMAREILIAELGAIDYESFVNTDDGLQAYIQQVDFNQEQLDSLFVLSNPDFIIDTKSLAFKDAPPIKPPSTSV